MKQCSFTLTISMTILLFSSYAIADAQIHEWIGPYDMNHDGWVGTLTITDSKK